MIFEVGDRVRLLDEAGQGTIIAKSGNQFLTEIDGIEMLLNPKDLVKVEFDELVSGTLSREELSAKDKLQRIEGRNKLKNLEAVQDAVYEIDLHMHELLDRFDHMTSGERLTYQMNACRSFVREAVQKKYKKVILIHGVGEGVLRTEIHRWLNSQERLEFHDAPYRTYGYGATEVIIH